MNHSSPPNTPLLDLCLEVLEAGFNSFFDVLDALIGKKSHDLNARFVDPGAVLSRRNRGFRLTGKKSLSIKDSFTGAMIVGGTGSGKSSVTLIPSLLSMEGSLVVHDPSGELHTATAGALAERGYLIKTLNLADARHSIGYNPLERARTTSDIGKVADTLVRASLGTSSSNPFWDLQARKLISVLIQITRTLDANHQNLANVKHLLHQMSADPKKVDRLFAQNAGDELLSEYKAFIANDPKVAQSVQATAEAALLLWSDPDVCRVTSYDTLNLESFRTRKVALFLQNRVADIHYYAPLSSLFFDQMFAEFMRELPRPDHEPVFFLLDECASLHIPSLPIVLANVRKHRAGACLVLQDEAQLAQKYGPNDAHSIKSNCISKLYMSGQGLQTARELEQILGRYTYKDAKDLDRTRQLMTADEIRTMERDEAIFLFGNRRPSRVRLTPYYKQRKLEKLTRLPAPSTRAAFYMAGLDLVDLNSL